MIGRLNHVAVAVKSVREAAAIYRDALGARVSEPLEQPEHGVTIVFVDLGDTRLELLEPLGEQSPIARFMEKNPDGGMHHLCFETPDLAAARAAFEAQGGRTLGEAKIGAHGRPVLFLHPKDCAGTLIELEQV